MRIPGKIALNDEKQIMTSKKNELGCAGYCDKCATVHSLSTSSARLKAEKLICRLEHKKSISLSTEMDNSPLLSTTPLLGEQRGKMFGVLECLNRSGENTWLYAFSGQYNGLWQVKGWAPPLFDIATFTTMNDPVEKRIKLLGKNMERFPDGSQERSTLTEQRRQLSRQLMIDIHDLYRLQNFNGTVKTLHQAHTSQAGKPTGTGDCCAPKLLNFAARSDLLPLSLAEFYFGRSNRSQTKKHGTFYSPCSDKCQPLLGFLLCGIEQRRSQFVN